MSKKKCPICGTEMKIDTSAVCTSIPPKYRCVCPSCNYLDFIKTSEYDQYKEEPSLSSDLDEAAEKYTDDSLNNLGAILRVNVSNAFKAGAQWMAGQGVILNLSIDEFSCGAYNACVEQGLTSEDDVIVQIRKA